MQTFNIRHYFSLSRNKVIGVILFTLSIGVGSAQDPTWTNIPNYDERFMHYGFSIGLNSNRFKAKLSDSFLSDTVKAVYPKSNAGFSLGFIVNFKLAEFFDLRVLPTVAFYEKPIDYTYLNGATDRQVIESTFIEMPLLLKYKSQRRNNLRMYMVGGLKGAIEAGAKKKDRKPSELRTNNMDLSIDYGVGFDIYYPLFKFSPEIRFSHGLVNMLNVDPNIYSRSLSKLTTHSVTLYLHFE